MNRSSTFPYASTQLTNNNPPPEIFYFKPRVETMDWREINQMDIDSLVEEGDMNSIQSVIQNLAFAKLGEDDAEKFGDYASMKLFRIGQLTIEYLLHTQEYLANMTKGLEGKYQEVVRETVEFEEKVKKQSKELKNRKKEIKVKENTLSTYEYLMKQPGGAPSKKVYPCNICKEKYFVTKEYLRIHISNYHPEYKAEPSVPQEEERKSMEEKIRKESIEEVKAMLISTNNNLDIKLENKLEELKRAQESKENIFKKDYKLSHKELTEVIDNKITSAVGQIRNIFMEGELERAKIGEEERRRKEQITHEDIEIILNNHFDMLQKYVDTHKPASTIIYSPVKVVESPSVTSEERLVIPQHRMREELHNAIPPFKGSIVSQNKTQTPLREQIFIQDEYETFRSMNSDASMSITQLSNRMKSNPTLEELKSEETLGPKFTTIDTIQDEDEEGKDNKTIETESFGNLFKVPIVINPITEINEKKKFVLETEDHEMGEVTTYFKHTNFEVEKEMRTMKMKMEDRAQSLIIKLALPDVLLHNEGSQNFISPRNDPTGDILRKVYNQRIGDTQFGNTVKEVEKQLQEVLINSKNMSVSESLFSSVRHSREPSARPGTGQVISNKSKRGATMGYKMDKRPNTTEKAGMRVQHTADFNPNHKL